MMRATRVTRVRRYGEGPAGRNLRDSRKTSGGGSRTRVDRPRLGESKSLSSRASCSDLRTEPRKEYREECGSEGTRGRARDMSSENSFSQSSKNILTKRRSASLHRSETRPRKPSTITITITSHEGIDDLIEGIDDLTSALYPAKPSSFYSAPDPTGMSPKEENRVRRNVSRSKSPAVIYVDNALNGLNGFVKHILTKRRSASLHRSETRPRKPSTSREGIDDLISALYPVKSSSFYSAPDSTGMSPKEDNRVRRNVSRSKSPAVIYVDNALNGLNGPVKHKVSINLIREQKGVGADENANVRRESWTRETQVRKQQDDESSQQRSGLGGPLTPDEKELLQKRAQRDEDLRRLKAEIKLPSQGPRTPDEKELLQKRAQRDEDLRRLKAEIKLPSQNGRSRSHGESTRSVTRIVGRRNSDLGSNARYSPGETRSSASWRRSKRVSFSSELDLTLGEVAEEFSEEFNGQSDISMSLPSSLKTPESPDDWHKYLDKSSHESGGPSFDMMIDLLAMKSTLPFKSSEECRSIVSRAKSLSNFPPPPPLHKHNHRKSGKGLRILYPPPPPPRSPGLLPDSGLRRKLSSLR